MEDKNLPDMEIERKKKEKKGFLPWLRQKLGLGGPSGGGVAGEANMMNVGRGLGTAGGRGAGLLGRGGGLFGRGGLFGPGGLLAGKAGMLATMAVVAAVIGTTLYMRNAQSPSDMAASGVGSGYKSGGSDYIPAIQRAGSNASSLDMLKEANKGFAGEEEAAKEENKDEKPADEAPPAEEPVAADAAGIGGDMAAKLQGFNATSLLSTMGGNNGNMPFGSKFGQGAFGPKIDFSGVGSGFANLPKYAERKNKILAMNQQKKSVKGKSAAGKRGAYGKKALDQARGVKDTQAQYTATGIEGQRGTQDLAWEGRTGSGSPTGGGGLGTGDVNTGGGGIATTPSIDNTSPSDSGGDSGDSGDPNTNTNREVDNPWGNLTSQIMMSILIACALAYVASMVAKIKPYGYIAAIIIGAIAAGFAIKALMDSITLISEYGQNMMGTIYIVGSVLALAGAICSMAGKLWSSALQYVAWLAGAAALIAMLGSMASGS